MKKKIYIIIVVIVLLILSITVISYHFRDRRTYGLDLPQLEEIKCIELEKDASGVAIFEPDSIEEIRNIILGVKRITTKESIQDVPVNVDNEIIVQVYLNDDEEASVTLFVYKKFGICYIEQPYNGIYKISKEEYNKVNEYLTAAQDN